MALEKHQQPIEAVTAPEPQTLTQEFNENSGDDLEERFRRARESKHEREIK